MMRILDPTLRQEAIAVALPRAARRAASAARRSGCSPQQVERMALLDRIAGTPARRHQIGDVVRVSKTNASALVSESDADLLAGRCAAVITAIGD